MGVNTQLYTHSHTYLHTYTVCYTCTHTYLITYTVCYTCTHTHIHTHTHIYIRIQYVTHAHAHPHIRTHTHTHTNTLTQTYMHVYFETRNMMSCTYSSHLVHKPASSYDMFGLKGNWTKHFLYALLVALFQHIKNGGCILNLKLHNVWWCSYSTLK